jgi:hypothetical protein
LYLGHIQTKKPEVIASGNKQSDFIKANSKPCE